MKKRSRLQWGSKILSEMGVKNITTKIVLKYMVTPN